MVTATVTSKGQIVIPAKIRRRHGIKAGVRFRITERGDKIVLQPLTKEYFEKMCGILRDDKKESLTEALLKERRSEREREERKWSKF
jgi:AbrB family looped-hinge helix DNA binding protein